MKARPKDVFTTGEVAKICRVAPRTASKWCDAGRIGAFRIPGSKDRRIPREALLHFMESSGFPLHWLNAVTGPSILVYGEGYAKMASALEDTLRDKVLVVYAKDAFEAGMQAAYAKPTWMVVDWTDPKAEAMVGRVRATHPNVLVCIVAAQCPNNVRHALKVKWPMVIDEPVTIEAFINKLVDASKRHGDDLHDAIEGTTP